MLRRFTTRHPLWRTPAPVAGRRGSGVRRPGSPPPPARSRTGGSPARRCAAGRGAWFQAHALGQLQVAGDDVQLPAGEVALQAGRPFGPELRVLLGRHPFAVRRVGDDPAMVGRRLDLAGITHFETDRVRGQPGALGVVAGELDCLRIQVIADQRRVQLGQDAGAGVFLEVAPAARSWPRSRSKPKGREMPGGTPSAIQAASIRMVPEPQNGSSSGAAGSQPARASMPAARFSRSGPRPCPGASRA